MRGERMVRPNICPYLSVSAVIFYPKPDWVAAVSDPVLIGIPQAERTATVFLLIKFFILGDINHAICAAAFAPVMGPICKIFVLGGGPCATAIDLLHILPTRGAESAREDPKTVFFSVESCSFKAHVKTQGAAVAPLWLHFIAVRALKPIFSIIVQINERRVQLVCVALVFLFTKFIFFAGMNVGVIEQDCVVDTRSRDLIHHIPGTGRAAGVEQDLRLFPWGV